MVSLRHESYEVRRHALRTLLHLLRSQHQQVCALLGESHHDTPLTTKSGEVEVDGGGGGGGLAVKEQLGGGNVLEHLSIALIGEV